MTGKGVVRGIKKKTTKQTRAGLQMNVFSGGGGVGGEGGAPRLTHPGAG